MPSPFRISLAAGVLLAACALPLAAQGRNVPGTTISDPSRERDSYSSEVSQQIEQLVGQWCDAWQNDDVRVLTGLYTRDAYLSLGPAGDLRTRREIEDRLRQELPRLGAIRTVRTDFGTSGDMAYEVGEFTYTVESPAGGEAAVRSGRYTLVARRSWNEGWQIRSHTLVHAGAGQ